MVMSDLVTPLIPLKHLRDISILKLEVEIS